MSPCTFQRIADIDNLVLEGRSAKRAVILLHGYGANFSDLTSLASVLDPQSSWDWFFPNGPLDIPGMGEYAGRAWFPIDMQRLEQAYMRGDRQPFRSEIPLGFESASMILEKLVKDLKGRYDQIVVGGFSQGSMIASDFALQTEQKIDGLLLLSSNIIASARWQTAAMRKRGAFPVFQSHGVFDNVLPLEGADALKSFWSENGFRNDYISFQGGHEIPYGVTERLKLFLSSL